MAPSDSSTLQTAQTLRNKPEWLNRKQAANYLTSRGCPISADHLAALAMNNNAGKGPAYTRFRWRSVSYLKDDLEAWIKRESVRIE